jgi:hypothetical protein
MIELRFHLGRLLQLRFFKVSAALHLWRVLRQLNDDLLGEFRKAGKLALDERREAGERCRIGGRDQ